MRSKEVAHDYRYFPDPDLVEIHIDEPWIEQVRAEIPELPAARTARFEEKLGLSNYDARNLTASKAVADYYEAALAIHDNPKGLANWVLGEVLRWLGEDTERTLEDYPVSTADLAGLVKLIDDDTISGKIAKQVYAAMMEGEGAPGKVVKERGLVQITDTSAIEPVIEKVIADNPKSVEDLKAGKDRAMGALVGQVMRATQGKANPKLVNELIRSKLGLS